MAKIDFPENKYQGFGYTDNSGTDWVYDGKRWKKYLSGPIEHAVFHALYPDDITFEMLGVKGGIGNLSVTHTSKIHQKDHEDIYRLVATNEPVWSGGRVVENLIESSNDLTHVSWVDAIIGTGLAPIVTANAGTSPVGSLTASRVILDLDGGTTTSDISLRRNSTLITGDAIHSCWVKSFDGSSTYTAQLISPTGGSVSITITGSWKRFSVAAISTTNILYGIRLRGGQTPTHSDSADLLVWGAQAESGNGRSDTSTPSEVVETATVPVTKVFANVNGNSVASNVVTEGIGAALAEVLYLQYYPAATNDQIQSNDLTDVEWTATTMTVAQDEVGIDAAPNSACTLTATGANSTVIANAITAASEEHAHCWYIKRKTGTGNVDITLDNGVTWTTVTLTTSFVRFSKSQATLTNPQIGIRLVASGDAVIVGNAEGYLIKSEAEVRGLGPIFTTTAETSTDSIDPISVPVANHSDASGLYYFEWIPSYATSEASGDQIICTLNGSAGLIYYDATAGTIKATDGTNTVSVTKTVVAGTSYKIALTYNASDAKMQISCDSTDGTEGTYDGAFTTTGDLEFAGGGTYSQKIRDWKRYNITTQQDGYDIRDGLLP